MAKTFNRREALVFGVAGVGVFALTANGVNAQGQANLTFWTVRLNTPELAAAMKGILDDVREGASGDQGDPRARLRPARLPEVPRRGAGSVDAGRRRGLHLPSATVRRARPDGADGRHHGRVEEERPLRRGRQQIRHREEFLERPLLGGRLQPRHPPDLLSPRPARGEGDQAADQLGRVPGRGDCAERPGEQRLRRRLPGRRFPHRAALLLCVHVPGRRRHPRQGRQADLRHRRARRQHQGAHLHDRLRHQA